MAAKESQKSFAKRKLNVEMFAYDVFIFTLPMCGFPVDKLKAKVSKQNVYSNSDYIPTIHASVISIALSRRDEWKPMFDSRLTTTGLGNMEKIKTFLSAMVKITTVGDSNDRTKTLKSLAVYSEFMLFLNSKNIEFNFETLINKWCNFFIKEIVLDKDPNELLETLCVEYRGVYDYIDLLMPFLENVANPYGSREDVSVEFGKFSEEMKERDYYRMKTKAEKVRELVEDSTGFVPHEVLDPDAEGYDSLLDSILLRNRVLPGNRDSSESPEIPDDLSVPRAGASGGVEDNFARMDLGRQEVPRLDSSPSKKKSGRKNPKRR